MNNRNIRKASLGDLEKIMSLIAEGRQKMIETGNPNQWDAHRPSKERVEADIAQGYSYLVLDTENRQEKAVATFAFIPGPDPTYAFIEGGSWLDEAPYYVIHRVASTHGVHGVMKSIVNYCLSETDNIRIDTHEDNKPMRGALVKLGFQYCGIIYLENGDERVAYQLHQ